MTQIALVGCAHIHIEHFTKRLQNRPDITVKWVWDHQVERAEKRANQLNAQVTLDVETIWADPSVSGVIICSETNLHTTLVLPAARAKKHLFVEKPLGMNAQEAQLMAEAVEEAGVLFQTGYFMRGNPIHLFLREQIKAGNFGKITRIRHSTCHSGSLGGWFDTQWRWMADLEQAGVGGFGDLGTHSLDILLWLMEEEAPVTSVTASIQIATGRYGDCDEFGEGLLNFKGGAVGSLAAGWVDVAHPVNLILSGTEGHAHVVDGNLYFKSKHVAGADGKAPWTDLPAEWPHAFNLFLDALAGQKNIPLVGVQEAARRTAIMEALYEGARQQRWINI